MARKALKLASWTGMALAASGFFLYSNKYLDPNDFGAVRVGRAVATVGFSYCQGGRGTAVLPAGVCTCNRYTCQPHVWSCMCALPCAKLPLHSSTGMGVHPQAPIFLYAQPLSY